VPVRVVVYTDAVYREIGGAFYGEIAFTLFVGALASAVDEVTVVGRLDPDGGASHYPLPPGVRFVPLPYYASLSRPLRVISTLYRSLRLYWRTLDDADGAWLFGPYLHAQLFAAIAAARRRRVVLGVRQDFPAYVRRRRPGVRWMHLAADVLEGSWRMLAHHCRVVVVGPALASHYTRAKRLLVLTVSLISSDDISAGEDAATRSYDGELTLLSVGRLDEEKNPLLLADILASLRRDGSRWRMIVCGDGDLQPALAERLAALGLSDAVELRGHVALHEGLLELYRSSHAFVHVSWTEGLPQVLTEAFASGVPVVATAVGGVPEAVDGAALLIPPGDAEAAAAALVQVTSDAALRQRLVLAGFANARHHTLERELERVVEFIGRP
jgi:glycosyltransferase involved in cell wall biosynthesis